MAYNKEYDVIPLPKLIEAFEEMTGDLDYKVNALRVPEKIRETKSLLRMYNSILGRLKRLKEMETQLKLDL